ncbi:glycoside hydrolase family 5 protein [bacterium]
MRFKGLNIGGWLLMEGYILGGRNISVHVMEKKLKKRCGAGELEDFRKKFKDTFITEEDFSNIAKFKADAVRIPFHYNLIESKPFTYNKHGLNYLKKAVKWAEKYKIKVILDLHAACGAQNADWHSDSSGKALLWEKPEYQERTYRLWEYIAEAFKNNNNIIGYDLINEPILEKKINRLTSFYKKLIKRIRAVDKKHILYVEGNNWATDISMLPEVLDDRVHVSIHSYEPYTFTLNFVPGISYPGTMLGCMWNKKQVYKQLEYFYNFAGKYNTEIYVGEFGVNWRSGYFGETQWLNDKLSAFDEFGFSYTYWVYKAAAGYIYPDGLYQYIPNSPYIRREGLIKGIETYPEKWKKEKDKIIEIWRTKNYTPNKELINILKKHFIK